MYTNIHPKGNRSWIFIGRTDAEAETPILWPPDAKSWLIGKDPDAGKDWGPEEKGMTEDEMVGWHHRLSGSWWWTGRPGVLRFMGSQTVGHDWATERNWTGTYIPSFSFFFFFFGFPIQVTKEHWVEFPKLHNGFSSLIYFIHSISSVYVSAPVSRFIAPSPLYPLD